MKNNAYLATVFALLPLGLACNPAVISATDGGDADGGTVAVDPCIANPNSSALCWADGANNGGTINASCPAGSATTITGTVNIPAGNLPLYNAKVYISKTPAPVDPLAPSNLPPIDHGATCDTCDKIVPLDAVASTTTDIKGNFTLANIPTPPDGQAMYAVVRVGKWRRSIRIENQNSTNAAASKVTRCATTALAPAATRLPRNQKEGDIPRIALSTGSADALECILRSGKLGLDDAEFTLESASGSVNLYAGNGANTFSTALGGKPFTSSWVAATSMSWWDSGANWNKYDIVMLSCEGGQHLEVKSPAALGNLQSYINAGGRVFASHYHNAWIDAAVQPLKSVATFVDRASPADPLLADIVTTLPAAGAFTKGVNLKTWLDNAGKLTAQKQLSVGGGRNTINSVDPAKTQTWVTYGPQPNPVNQYFSFYAPVGAAPTNQCGQMVFTDLHVAGATSDTSAAGTGNKAFPSGCTSTGLTPQEAALIFMFFDLTNCVQPTIG